MNGEAGELERGRTKASLVFHVVLVRIRTAITNGLKY